MVETLQSLIVAFVLAMAFRGFVVEGFVIPTGSMAPTLMGSHALVQSHQTGWTFAAGMDPGSAPNIESITDPMLGPGFAGASVAAERRPGEWATAFACSSACTRRTAPYRRSGLQEPHAVPQGDEANYIKRLVVCRMRNCGSAMAMSS